MQKIIETIKNKGIKLWHTLKKSLRRQNTAEVSYGLKPSDCKAFEDFWRTEREEV